MSDEKDSALRTGSGSPVTDLMIEHAHEVHELSRKLFYAETEIGRLKSSLNKSDDCPEKSFTDGYSAGYACGRSGSARKDFDALVAWRAARCASEAYDGRFGPNAGSLGEVVPRASTGDRSHMLALARKAIESRDARKDEDVDAWAARLAGDSVACGESEYGADHAPRTSDAQSTADVSRAALWLGRVGLGGDHHVQQLAAEFATVRVEALQSKLRQIAEVQNTCEHGDHPAPPNKRFCSDACALCERDSEGENGCDGICRRASGEVPPVAPVPMGVAASLDQAAWHFLTEELTENDDDGNAKNLVALLDAVWREGRGAGRAPIPTPEYVLTSEEVMRKFRGVLHDADRAKLLAEYLRAAYNDGFADAPRRESPRPSRIDAALDAISAEYPDERTLKGAAIIEAGMHRIPQTVGYVPVPPPITVAGPNAGLDERTLRGVAIIEAGMHRIPQTVGYVPVPAPVASVCAGCAKVGRARARGEMLECAAHPEARHATADSSSATPFVDGVNACLLRVREVRRQDTRAVAIQTCDLILASLEGVLARATPFTRVAQEKKP